MKNKMFITSSWYFRIKYYITGFVVYSNIEVDYVISVSENLGFLNGILSWFLKSFVLSNLVILNISGKE